MASIFSRIVSGEIPAWKITENEEFLAFFDVFPIAKGHALVVPKQEIDYIFDMDDAQLSRMHLFAKKVANAMKPVFPCVKIGIAVIGLEVPHAHIHLVPMNGIQDMNFQNPRLKFSDEEYKAMIDSVQKHL